ncbi:MAG TPA: YdcF family protein [Chitinophagaceae bacterium]|nr:YdcF family protein [Chitinophagaceae bacterium]
MQLLKKNRYYKPVRLIFFFLLIWLCTHILYLAVNGVPDYRGSADVAIVLGNVVYNNGNLSPWLKTRVDKAIELYREGRVKKIFVSGGRGKGKYHYPEGDAMRAYLIKMGIPEMVIIKDNEGVNSYYTAKNFIELTQKEHFSSAIIVTHFYHIARCRYILNKLGFHNLYSVSADRFHWVDLPGAFRDVVAYYKYVAVY